MGEWENGKNSNGNLSVEWFPFISGNRNCLPCQITVIMVGCWLVSLRRAACPDLPVKPVTVSLSGCSLDKPGGIYLPERSAEEFNLLNQTFKELLRISAGFPFISDFVSPLCLCFQVSGSSGGRP